MSQDKKLPINFSTEIIEEGWLGKLKGSFQILFERGWIDPSKLSKHTEKGHQDEMGILMEDMSIKVLMEKQQDFMSEVTLLQFHGSALDVTIDRSPKCHLEITDEGKEFIWAIAKMNYRSQPISRKRTKKDFFALVKECFSTVVVDTQTIRAYSRRCRENMFMYSAIDRYLTKLVVVEKLKNEKGSQNQKVNSECDNNTFNENINHTLKTVILYL